MNLPEYYVCDPTGNITVLVSGERNAETARQVMKAVPSAEQVGFLTNGGLCLTMAGGEFCGNASMSAAALYCEKTGDSKVSLQVSGADRPVEVDVSKNEDGSFACTVKMPDIAGVSAERLTYGEKTYNLPAVRMQGICHIIFEGELSRKDAEAAAKKWCGDLSADALGIMFFDREQMKLTPLVYVPAAETLFWESSCASGTSALGAYLACSQNKTVSAQLLEPAGILKVKASPEGAVYLTGSVKIL